MRILYLIDTLSLGGAQTVLRGIFENQNENHDIFLYALRKTEVTVRINHPNVFIDDSANKYSVAPFFRVISILKKNKIEVLHCQLPRSQVFGYFIKKYFCRKLKLIIHEQGDIFENIPIHSHFLRKATGFTSFFIACSNVTRGKLISKAGIDDNKAITLYNFVDIEKFKVNKLKEIRSFERYSKKINDDNFVFGFAGRLIERKGWKEFVLSAIQLKKENTKFVIAGAGEQESELIQMITSLRLEEKIIYLGYCDDMIKFYSLIDCLVIPSHWEPMGITEIEAMALEIPVIASDVMGLNEVVKHDINGILFKAKNIESLVNAMEKILFLKELRCQITKTAFETIENFTYMDFQQKLNNIYKSLLLNK